MSGGWLDWREHSVGPARPCRICDRPGICRDEAGRACHKVCVEQHPTTTDIRPEALVVDLDTHRAARIVRRTA